MAERRSIYKKIVLSEAVDSLSNWAQLLFTWSIPHADDVGLLPRSAKMVKGTVFPLKENITIDQVEDMIQQCIKAGLYAEISIHDKDYLWIKNFQEHQTLKKDRQPNVLFKLDFEKNAKDTWAKLDAMVSKWNPNGIQMDTEEKGREGKRRERKGNRVADKSAQESPKASEFIKFFHTATKRIRNVEPIIDGGKDGRLIKTRLSKVDNDMTRLERMAIWYLTREKRRQDPKGNWYKEFKNSPSIATMLSTSYFNELLSEEANALTYTQENIDWIEKVYQKVTPKRDIRSEIAQLSEKFKV